MERFSVTLDRLEQFLLSHMAIELFLCMNNYASRLTLMTVSDERRQYIFNIDMYTFYVTFSILK